MTPFGQAMRHYRQERGFTLADQAAALGVSVAYLSALERGMRSRPSAALVDEICVWLGLIWDDAEQLKYLASLSHPRPQADTRNLSSDATLLANLVAQNIDRLSPHACAELTRQLQHHLKAR